MDAQKARIFLYENVNGIPNLRSDYYVSGVNLVSTNQRR